MAPEEHIYTAKTLTFRASEGREKRNCATENEEKVEEEKPVPIKSGGRQQMRTGQEIPAHQTHSICDALRKTSPSIVLRYLPGSPLPSRWDKQGARVRVTRCETVEPGVARLVLRVGL